MQMWVELGNRKSHHFYLAASEKFLESYVRDEYFIIEELPIPPHQADLLKMLYPKLSSAIDILTEVSPEAVEPPSHLYGNAEDWALRIITSDGKWTGWR